MSTQETTEEPWTVKRILDWTQQFLKGKGSESPLLDAQILLAHVRKCPRIQLYTQFDQVLTDSERSEMRELVKRRAGHAPVAYLVGSKEFFSLNFVVRPGVFIPRPDTETLVVTALEKLKELSNPTAIDLCAGSGCVSVAITKNHRTVQMQTVEKNPDVAIVTQTNIDRHQVGDRLKLFVGDLFSPIDKASRFDVVVSNPPYVQRAEIAELSPEIRDHEPHLALDGGEDGLDLIRQLAVDSLHFLKSGGWLMFELSPEQAKSASQILTDSGYTDVAIQNDLSGQARVVLGSKPKS